MDEFDALKSEAPEKHHPEDDSESTSEPDSDSETVRLNRTEEEKSQSGRGRSIPGTSDRDMMFKHSSHLSGSFQTGVKGVLSDAISYESALRKEKLQKSANAIHTGYSQSSRPRGTSSPPRFKDRNSDGESGEEDFVKTWRKNRMQELRAGQSNTRRRSPSKRKYGRVEVVDAVGYLDAVERVSSETIVVVTIYNDKSEESRFVEDCLNTLARRYATTRFVKLHHNEAEMDVAAVPAVLAYKGGELFANIMRIVDEIPSGRSLSTDSLELVLRRANVLHKD